MKQLVGQQHRNAEKLRSRPDQRLDPVLINDIQKKPTGLAYPDVAFPFFHRNTPSICSPGKLPVIFVVFM